MEGTAQYTPVVAPNMTIDEIIDECLKKYGTTQTYWRGVENDVLVIYFLMTMNFEGHKTHVFLKEIVGKGVSDPMIVERIPEGLELITIDEYYNIIEWAGV